MESSFVHCKILGLLLLAIALLSACTPEPTPYQPLGEQGGYEETRLQKNVYRVSFKANPYTSETDVLDYLYLRSAELTRQAGFSHFLIVQDVGKTQARPRTGTRFSLGLGFGRGIRGGHFGAGALLPLHSGYDGVTVQYRLGVFVFRMLSPEEAKTEPEALEIDFLMKSIHEKLPQTAK
ncbi:MAG: hypothetical protein O7B79_00755 [SAR324 cluster bacterium]|nr:hypothetical protein [SAR324 cluster bacterium]